MPSLTILLVPSALQAVAMLVDEGVFHRRRGLRRWERIGHPIDALIVGACYGWLLLRPPSEQALTVYVILAAASCILITRDEFTHAKVCEPLEHWLHAVLFVLHPIAFLAFGIIWWQGRGTGWIAGQVALTLSFAAYQFVYWNRPWKAAR
jgi:hypothetical protein